MTPPLSNKSNATPGIVTEKQRQGAGAVYLNVHHPDILRFLDTKRENADEKIRIKTLSLGVVIPDITFELAKRNEDMYLFSPYDVERVYGVPFSQVYVTEKYYEMVDNPEIKKTKTSARKLFSTLAELSFESGYPYLMFEDTVNRANAIDGKISMSNLCVTGDMEILTDRGYRKVIDLYESQEDFDVVVDTRARDMDLSNVGTAVEKSTKMFKTSENAEIFKVSTAEGFELRATEWHKMYVDRDGEIQKIQLNQLVPGDKVLVQPAEGAFGEIHNPDLAYIAGVIAADGTYAFHKNGSVTSKIYLYGDKDEFAEPILGSVHRVLEGREDLVERQSTLTPDYNVSEMNDRIQLHSAPLAKLLREHGFSAVNKTQVPEFVLRGDRETQRKYISGLFQLDATITGNAKNKSCSIELGSIDKSHLQQVQRMLLNFGIYTRIYPGRKVSGKAMLPDGKGGLKEYNQSTTYTLRTSSSVDRIALYNLVDWKTSHRNRWNELGGGREVRTQKSFHGSRATVTSVSFDGIEDVYDVTVDIGNSVIFHSFSTGNCSEILQTSEASTYKTSGEYDHVGRDISCNLASMNVVKSMEGGDIEKTVDTAIRALSTVSDISNIEEVPSIKRGNESSRAVGLGQMNLHGFFIREGMKYGGEDSLNFTNNYFMTVRYFALKTSNKLAKESTPFAGFEKSEYADKGYLIEKYSAEGMVNHSEKTLELFEKYNVPVITLDDWKKLAEDIEKDGLYNAYLMAVAPTGSISYINNSTSSIHPITDRMEVRKEGKTGTVYFPQPEVTNENFAEVENAYDLGFEKLIDVYAEATKHVDQGLSCTLFATDQHTTRDLNKAYIYAWRKGLKTIYYVRVRSSSIVADDIECVSCSI